MMRVMLDTNVLISAIVLNSVALNKMLKFIVSEHKLILSSYVIEELKQVVDRKFKGKAASLERKVVTSLGHYHISFNGIKLAKKGKLI